MEMPLIKDEWYRRGFYAVILALVGFIGGIYFAQHMIIAPKLDDAVKLKGIVINSQPYDLKERP